MKRIYSEQGTGPSNYGRSGLIIISLIFLAISCITPFEPEFKGASRLLVVDGRLIKGIKTQEVRISWSTSVSEPVLQHVGDCSVRITDDAGNEFIFTEESPGRYVANIDDALLNYFNHYKLKVTTPSGGQYESDYQALPEAVPVDSVYAIKETQYVRDANDYLSGLQFYVDLDAPDNASRYYRWQVVETWEIHAQYRITGVYDGKTVLFTPNNPSDSLYYCWNSKTAEGIYTYSTPDLLHNRISKVPLHFKAHDSPDMTIKYSATVRQFPLDEDAYYYWHQKEKELNESGNLYTSQPAQLKSNIHNTMNPDEKVIGYFWVSSVTEKHLFQENPFDNPIATGPSGCTSFGTCTKIIDEEFIESLYPFTQYTRNFPYPPVYIYNIREAGLNCVYFTKDECIDCRRIGGKNSKPDFWE